MVRRLVIGALLAVALTVLVSPASAATCTAAQKRKHVAALKKFQRQLPIKRRAYFRTHGNVRARRAFVRRQRARLKRLRRAASCSTRPVIDLAIAFSERPATSPSRRRVSYRLRVTNRSGVRARQVSILASWSSGTIVVSTSAEDCGGRGLIACDLGSLSARASKTLEVVLRPLQLGRLDVEADVYATDARDPKQANNHVAAAVELAPPAPACPPRLWPGLSSGFLGEGDLGEDHIGHPSQGVARALMVFVDFPDAPGSESTAELYQLLVPEAARMFSEISYGRFALDVTGLHRWVRLPHPSTSQSALTVLRDAVAALDPEVDFRQFGLVYVVTPASVSIPTGAYVIPPGFGAQADGIYVRHGALIGADARLGQTGNTPARILFHETGHALGLPDLYELGAANHHRFVGSWDPMGSLWPTGHFLAWHKWRLGWLDAAQVGCLAGPGMVEETLSPVALAGGVKAIVALTGPSTAFVVEARRQIGEDSDLCEEGVLVYTVDGSVATGAGPVRVRPAQPDGPRAFECTTLYEAPFDVAPGEVPRFEDAEAGVTVEVLSASPEGYRVRVTKR